MIDEREPSEEIEAWQHAQLLLVTNVNSAQLQAVPLSVNPLGAPLLPVWVAWKPMVVEPPGGMVPL